MIVTQYNPDTSKNDLARAKRIGQAIAMAADRGINQSEIARECKVSPQAVYRWKKTGQIGLDHLVKLASLSGASKDWLADGSGSARAELDLDRRQIIRVPLVSWIAVSNMRDSTGLHKPDIASEWIETTAQVSGASFALRVSGDSMTNPHGSPSIPDGSVVVVDPTIKEEPGNIILVKSATDSEPRLRRLVSDGGTLYLKPLNPAYPLAPKTGDHVVYGVAKQVIQEL